MDLTKNANFNIDSFEINNKLTNLKVLRVLSKKTKKLNSYSFLFLKQIANNIHGQRNMTRMTRLGNCDLGSTMFWSWSWWCDILVI